MKTKYKLILALMIAILFVLSILKMTGVFFETNDDRVIAEILSGAAMGKPSAHVVYVNYFLSFPISVLYNLTNQVPWYGGMLIFFHIIVWFVILWSVYENCKTKLEMVYMTFLVGCFFLLNIYLTAKIQYTSTAALLALAGYACLILQKKEKRGVWIFFLIELFALLLRQQAMLMVQPIGVIAYITTCLIKEGDGLKTKCRKICGWGIAIALVLLIGKIGTSIGYQGEEWKAYERFNDSRTVMFDYYGMPAFEEVKEILDKYEVSEVEYNAFCNYVILDRDVPLECVEELAEYTKKKNRKSLDLAEMFSLIKAEWNEKNMGINKSCCLIGIMALLWVVLSGRWKLLIPTSGLIAVHTVILGYLLYMQRTPARVMYPLWLSVGLMLIVLLVQDHGKVKPRAWATGILVILTIVWARSCLDAGKEQYRYAVESNRGQRVYMEGLVEVQQYCSSHPDNCYILDAWSFSHYHGSALEHRIYQNTNSVLSGSWYSNSPEMRQYIKEHVDFDSEQIKVIIYDDGLDKESILVKFMQEKTGKSAKLIDSLMVSNGANYLVYDFSD